jgi:uncharacterized cupin superfamily protein
MKDTFYRLSANPEGGMQPSNEIAAESFTTDDHTETINTHFETSDESITVGVWECAPCRVEFESYPDHEMMTVISGSLTLTGPDGRSETYTVGDTFFVAKGTKCTWENTETFKKFYMIAA